MSIKVNINDITYETRQKVHKDLELKLEDQKYAKGQSRYIYPYELDGNDLHLPFTYAVDDLKLDRPARSSFPAMSVKFKGKLREEQKEAKKEALVHINKLGSVLMSMYCGFGKTITSINIACAIRLKTLIIVNKIVLMKQWEESILKFCPSARVQRLTPKTKKKDADFYIMNAINIEKKSKHFFSEIGLAIVDECFPYQTPILTNNNYKYIGELNEGDQVTSYNEKTKMFELKNISKTRKIELEKYMVNISFSSGTRKIRCTENHKFLTNKGYKNAIDLVRGDLIISKYTDISQGDITKALNDDQLQLVIGSFLGDGHLAKLKSGRYRMSIIHGEKQLEYCRWKANMFGISTFEYIEKNGYAKKPAYRFTTKFFDIPDLPSTKEICPEWIIDKMDERAMAIWYMDDGNIGKNGNYIILNTQSFSIEAVERLIQKLETFSIYARIKYDKKYPTIYINNKSTKRFLGLVGKYIHPSMKYKLHSTEYIKQLEDSIKSNKDIFERKEYIPKSILTPNNVYRALGHNNNVRSYKWKLCNKCNCYVFHMKEIIPSGNTYWRCNHKKEKNGCREIIPFNLLKEQYEWNNSFEKYGYLRVKEIEIDLAPREKYVYDIEVQDNHNFIVCSKTGLNGAVVHNCHLIMAERLSKSMQYIHPRYLIGLTATPYRPDGLNVLLDLYFGKYKVIRKLYREHTVYRIDTGFKPKMEKNISGRLDWNKVLESQAEDHDRNEMLIRIIKKFPKRIFMVLVKRVSHGEHLEKRLKEEGEHVTTLLGSNQEFDKDARILIGTTSKISTGFDHAVLNTLLLAADLEQYYIQALGRIFRKKDIKPMVFDPVDNCRILEKHWQSRRKVYIEAGGSICNMRI